MKFWQRMRERDSAELASSGLGVLTLIFILLMALSMSYVHYRDLQDQHYLDHTSLLKEITQEYTTQVLLTSRSQLDTLNYLSALQDTFNERYRILKEGQAASVEAMEEMTLPVRLFFRMMGWTIRGPARKVDQTGEVEERLERIGANWKEMSHTQLLRQETLEPSQQDKERLEAVITSVLNNYNETKDVHLIHVNQDIDELIPVSAELIGEINALRDRFQKISKKRIVTSSWSLSLGLMALLCLIFRSVLERSITRRRINEISRLKQVLDDEAEQNQQAIELLLEEMQGLSKGDLTIQASVGAHFTGAIAQSFNTALDALRQLALTIIETTAQVSASAQGTQSTAIYLAEASEHQFEQITTASTAISEMALSIGNVSHHADESAQVAQQSVDLSLKGAETVRDAIEGMDTIREQIQETSKRIKRLSESSQEIGNIVELINDIADLTNMLALNASIEAARAGDAGRGFAVVADEVHRLAERSGDATSQIEALVKTIQTDTHEAMISMEKSTAGVVSGARLIQDAAAALHAIENVSLQLAELVKSISGSAKEQVNTTGEISQTMTVIQEITSQTLAGTNETADAIGHLAELVSELRESVAGFKLPLE